MGEPKVVESKLSVRDMFPKKIIKPHEPAWGTYSEIEFITYMGTGRFTKLPLDRLELLEKYLIAMDNRVVWKNMNPNLIKKEVEKQIKAEKEKRDEKLSNPDTNPQNNTSQNLK